MSDLTAEHPKPWWKRWWGITLIVFGVLIIIGLFAGDPEDTSEQVDAPAETAQPTSEPAVEPAPTTGTAESSSSCQDADPALVAAIEEGLTVNGGGSLANAKMVPVPEDRRITEDWPHVIVAAEITGAGMEDVVGAWGMTTDDSGFLFALDPMAREFSDWGGAMGAGSPADEQREAAENLEETSQAMDCAGS